MKDLPRHRLLAIAIGCTLFAGPLYAADGSDETRDDPKVHKLDAVTVTGTLLGDSSKTAVNRYAGSRQVIGHDELVDSGYRSLDDALQHVPGIKIFDETGTGVLPQIMLRGLYESRSGRVQLLEDGIPLSLAPYGQTSLSLFPVTFNQIERIDVVRGGAAVQYGPNNVGGVINLVSRPIPEKWTTTIGEKITAGGAGHFLRDTSLSTGGYLTPNFGLQLDADSLKGGYWRDHSGTDVKNVRLRAEWWIADDTLLKASVERYVADMDLAGALTVADYQQNPRQATRPLDAFDGRTTRSSLTYQRDLGAWGPFDQAQLSWTSFDWRSDRNFEFGTRISSAQTWLSNLPAQLDNGGPRTFSVYGTQPQLNLHMRSGGVSQQWALGARAESESIGYLANATSLVDGSFSQFRDWQFRNHAWSAYVSDAVGFDDDRFVVTPGLRYEHLDSNFRDLLNVKQYQNDIRNLLPGLTVGYQASSQWYVYTDAQRSLRAPQVTQIVYGNNLDSELAWNYEVGARYRPGDSVNVNVDLYRINFDKQIQYNSTTASYYNIGKTRNQGAEAQLEWNPAWLRQLRFDAGYAYLDAAQESGQYEGKRVPFTSRNQFNLGANYTLGDTNVALNSYYFSKAYTDAANTRRENAIASIGELPAYWIWNAQLSRILLRTGGSVLRGTLAMNNIFDKHYWFRGIDTSPWGREPGPERTVTVGAELSF